MARLLMNYIERYHNLLLCLVYIDKRMAYLSSLEASWQQNTTAPIVHKMHTQLVRLLEESITRPSHDE